MRKRNNKNIKKKGLKVEKGRISEENRPSFADFRCVLGPSVDHAFVKNVDVFLLQMC